MADIRSFKDLESKLTETERAIDAYLGHQQRTFRVLVARRFSDPNSHRDLGDQLKAEPDTLKRVFKETHDRLEKLFALYEAEERAREQLTKP